MKYILHVITTINRGGAENHLIELVAGQVARGLTVSVAYLKGDGYWTNALASLGVSVIPLGLSRYGDVRPLLLLRSVLQSCRPDVVHAHMPPAELYARLAILLTRGNAGALVISKHNDEPFYRGSGQQFLGRWVAHRAKRVIAISSAVKKYAHKHLGLPEQQVIAVPYGIDPKPYLAVDRDSVTAVRRAWGVPDDAWVVGTVARFVPQKALHTMLRGYARYRATAKCESRLVLVGRGPLEQDLRELAKALGITDAVVWAGFREDIPAVMSAFDCFALTSIYEGFGLVLLEAMAAGKPVVASSVSAIPEVVLDGETGLLCPPEDDAALSYAFSLMENEKRRVQFGGAGAKRAIEQFSLERMVSRTLDVYREATA